MPALRVSAQPSRPRSAPILPHSYTEPLLSAIVLWEIAKLAQLGPIIVDLEHPDVVPADQVIAATRVVHAIPLRLQQELQQGRRIDDITRIPAQGG